MELTQDNSHFLKGHGGNYIHGYCLGNLQTRRLIKGLILKTAFLFTAKNIPEVNDRLTRDNLEDI